MEIVVQQCISRTHCIGIDKFGRTYVIEMPVDFFSLPPEDLAFHVLLATRIKHIVLVDSQIKI